MPSIRKITNRDLKDMTVEQQAFVYQEEKASIDSIDKRIATLKKHREVYGSINLGINDYCRVRINELEELREIHDYNLNKLSEDKKLVNADFDLFVSENFVLDPKAGPLLHKEVRSIFRDWKRSLGRTSPLRENQMLILLLTKAGPDSTDKMYWGIRQADLLPPTTD